MEVMDEKEVRSPEGSGNRQRETNNTPHPNLYIDCFPLLFNPHGWPSMATELIVSSGKQTQHDVDLTPATGKWGGNRIRQGEPQTGMQT